MDAPQRKQTTKIQWTIHAMPWITKKIKTKRNIKRNEKENEVRKNKQGRREVS